MDPSSKSTATRALANVLGDEDQAGLEAWSNNQPPPLEAATTTKETKILKGMDLNIFMAATQGNIDALKEHMDVLHQILTPTNNTVLHVYIAYESSSAAAVTKSVDQLLESTNNVKEMLDLCPPLLLQLNKSRETALHIAARYGRADIVEVLIQEAKARDSNGDNLEEGFGRQWQVLIRGKNCDEDTALHEAVRFNHLEVVKLLTKEDPEFVYPANKAGETPLYLAAERGHYDLVCEIVDNCRYAAYYQGPNCSTALHGAVISNDEKMTRKLLEKQKSMTQEVDEQGWTPLHLAAFTGHSTIARLLLECDTSAAYIRDKNKKRTPLHLAASQGRVDVMKEIVFRCPDCCELVDYKRQNVLHYAIQKHQLQVERFVRKDPWLSHVLLNGKDVGRNTPLHDIASSPYKEATDFISDDRVDKMAFNKENLNAINIIEKNNKSSPWKRILRTEMEEIGAYRGYRIPNPDQDGGRKLVHVNKNDNDLRDNVLNKKDLKDKEIKESHLVVSALISTVTFAAGFTVPGGYVSEKGPNQGLAVLSRNAAFKAFVITNTLAMSLSSCAIMVRFFLSLKGQHGSKSLSMAISCTFYALIAMVAAFLTGVYAVLGGHVSLGLAVTACVLGTVFFSVLGFVSISPAFITFRKRAHRFFVWIVSLSGLLNSSDCGITFCTDRTYM